MDSPKLSGQLLQDSGAPGWYPHRKRKFSATANNPMNSISQKHEDTNENDVTIDQSLDSAKRTRLSNIYADPTSFHTVPIDKSRLPMEVWHHIFSFLSPFDLGNLLHVNKTFNSYLNPLNGESLTHPTTPGFLKQQSPSLIWSFCRKNFHPGMPRPLASMTELDMWRLVTGASCQFCGKKALSQCKPLPWESGPGLDGVRIIWPFKIRSCSECLLSRVQKDVDVVLSSLPTFLVPALPFSLITPSFHVISSVMLRTNQSPSELIMTKYYYTGHIDDLKRKLAEVEAMGPAALEEWIKGLESEGREKTVDATRWEQWEISGGLRLLRLEEERRQAGWISPVILSRRACSHMNSGSGSASPSPDGKAGGREDSPLLSAASTYGSKLPPRPFSPPQPHTLARFSQQQQPRTERSLRDVNEAKALRRVEIERRCLDLNPPLTAAVLSHMDSFSASIQIPHFFTDRDWEILMPRLLAQRETAERKEQERVKQSRLLQAKSEERRLQEAHSKVAKELLDREWDDVQTPIRDQLAIYADELINGSWGSGNILTKDKCPRFAADVLMYVRNKFYAHIEDEDALARASGVTPTVDSPSAPPKRKLVLENMKWVFDSKIKPLTERFQKELFLCNGCENNSKFYGFEGVVQHYAAKHTNILSLGSVVVHWRAEWPEKPPFHPNPNAAKALLHTIPHNTISQTHGYSGQHGSAALYMATPEQRHRMSSDGPPVYSHQSPGPYGRSPFSAPFPYVQGPYRPPSPSLSPYFAASHTGYVFPPPQPGLQNSPFEQPIPLPAIYSSPYLGHAYPANYQPHDSRVSHPYPSPGYGGPSPSYPPPFHNPSHPTKRGGQIHPCHSPNNRLNTYKNQLDEMAKGAREAWNRTSGVKDLPNSIRVYVLIHHIASASNDQTLYELSIALFADGLNNHPQMKPLRNLSGLECRSCVSRAEGDVLQLQFYDRKTYTLPALVSHFQSMHLEHTMSSMMSNKGTEPMILDWRHDMVHLPNISVVTSLVHAAGMDDMKLRLIAEAFPEAFPSDPPFITPDIHSSTRKSIFNQKARSTYQSNKGRFHDAEVRRQPHTFIYCGEPKADNSSRNPGDLELRGNIPSVVSSPRTNVIPTLDSPGSGGNGSSHSNLMGLAYSHGNGKESRRVCLPFGQDDTTNELSDELHIDRDYNDPITRVQMLNQMVINGSLERDDAQTYSRQPNLTDASSHRGQNYAGDQFEYHDQHQSGQLHPADNRLNKRYTSLIKGSEDGELSTKVTRPKADQNENETFTEGMSAAERFLSSFNPGQDADTHKSNNSESDLQRDKSIKAAWTQSNTLEDRHWPHDRIPSSTAETGLHIPPSRHMTQNNWKRWGSLGPAGSREYDPKPDIRSNGIDQTRNYGGRSPDVIDNRFGRKIAGGIDSRRPHSRFDRYEAQRQGPLRPRSRSPSIRESTAIEGTYYEEQVQQCHKRSRFLYTDHLPRIYHRLGGTVACTRTPQRGDYRHVGDTSCVESLHEDSVDFLPLGGVRETRNSGAYHVERTSQHEFSRDHPDSEIGYSRQSAYEHPTQAYSSRVLSPHTRSPKGTMRQRAPFR